jgi:translation initiation factor 1
MNSNSRVVYSTETGRLKEEKSCVKSIAAKSDGIVRLRREVKGRGGGTVIIISGVPLSVSLLKDLAGELKKKCGCGGTVKNGIIEIQGDHRDTLMLELQTRGYGVKLAGGYQGK